MGAPESEVPLSPAARHYSYEHEGDRQFATTLARGRDDQCVRVVDHLNGGSVEIAADSDGPARTGWAGYVDVTVRRLARRNVALAAVSTGSFVLARAGLLSDRRCTVHWDYADSFAEAFPDIALCNDLFVVDGSILTCAGATAALDMMLQLIGAHHGQDLARQISGQFLHGGIRAAADDQRRMLLGMGVTNSVVQKAVSLMEAALEEPVPLTELTLRTGVSKRQLERLCRRYLGATPAQYYVQLRLERARRMLRQTDLSVAEVAIACDFVSLSHFAKVYRRHYGLSPREDRKAT